MATFELEAFVTKPTLDKIDNCRERDLEEIAVYFDLPYSRQLRKKELKALLVGKLMEMGVLVAEDGAPNKGEGSSLSPEGEPQGAGAAGEGEIMAGEQMKMPFTLPWYDPLSTGSTGSRDEARVKVCIAHLQCEAQERPAQAQLQHQETEVDSYFSAFERIALALQWPSDV
ncbi:hypothetical protein N1851_026651 [Merluccius polli]|uniref:Uncharacterized protein n=1 Tax=Merluccius polli TaxID=89951 RepID=A0AA47MBL9_MERPO|nr:hypothetical protein N1851_026651 [Merluccius polli]